MRKIRQRPFLPQLILEKYGTSYLYLALKLIVGDLIYFLILI